MRVQGSLGEHMKEEAWLRDASEEFARRWYSKAQKRLYDLGDEMDFEVYPVAQSAVPPSWEGDKWVFRYPHEAAMFFEYGAAEHEIEPVNADVLAFEWPDMAGEPFGDTGKTWDEVYASSWPTVFLPKVEHPGMPALRFIRDSKSEVEQDMKQSTLADTVDGGDLPPVVEER